MKSFKVFLSHRYKSPEVNLYFFNLISKKFEVQFEVDEGTFSTNVTRLERMLRSADAFMGIYPFPGSAEEANSVDELKKASRYFRLELDLAIRSQKPALVFYDSKYGNVLNPPSSVISSSFDLNEVTGAGGFPQAARHKKLFERFCSIVTVKMKYDTELLAKERKTVGLIIPQGSTTNYSPDIIETVTEAVESKGFQDIHVIKWPPVLDQKTFRVLEELDWAIVDFGDVTAQTGIPAFLHGKFMPMIRLKFGSSENPEPNTSPIENSLFGGTEVGYNKDLVVWNDKESIKAGLVQRLSTLTASVKRINTQEEAINYFRQASLRNEAVFLSYSGNDRDIAADIRIILKKYFKAVFDYRDGGVSIRPGEPWIEEIFNQLSSSAIGIPLMSESYFQSGNCMHEARQMIAQRDNKKMKVIPVKLTNESLTVPKILEDIQYLRRTEYSSTEEMVKRIMKLL